MEQIHVYGFKFWKFYSHIHSSIVDNSQNVETAHASINRWMDKQNGGFRYLAPDVADIPLAPLATQTPLHHLTRGNQFLGWPDPEGQLPTATVSLNAATPPGQLATPALTVCHQFL